MSQVTEHVCPTAPYSHLVQLASGDELLIASPLCVFSHAVDVVIERLVIFHIRFKHFFVIGKMVQYLFKRNTFENTEHSDTCIGDAPAPVHRGQRNSEVTTSSTLTDNTKSTSGHMFAQNINRPTRAREPRKAVEYSSRRACTVSDWLMSRSRDCRTFSHLDWMLMRNESPPHKTSFSSGSESRMARSSFRQHPCRFASDP